MFLQLIRLLLTDDVIYLQLTPIELLPLSSGPSFRIKGDQFTGPQGICGFASVKLVLRLT